MESRQGYFLKTSLGYFKVQTGLRTIALDFSVIGANNFLYDLRSFVFLLLFYATKINLTDIPRKEISLEKLRKETWDEKDQYKIYVLASQSLGLALINTI